MVGEEVLLSSKTLHLTGTRKLRDRFVGCFRVMEHIAKTAYRIDLKVRCKDVCKFGVVQCKTTCQNGPAGLDMPMRESSN